MKVVHTTPLLSAPGKSGTKYWRGEVATDPEGQAWVRNETWRLLNSGKESKHLFSEWRRIEPTNVGRSNERESLDQAVFELNADVEKAIKYEGYWPEGKPRPKAATRPRPMLAKRFDEDSRHIAWPAYVQPKLDGMRMLCDGQQGWSRAGNFMADARCIQHLLFDTGGIILDGELLLPMGEFSFQSGMSAAKKWYPALSPRLEYHVYDIVDTDLTFEGRWRKLQAIAKHFPPGVKLVVTELVRDRDEVVAAHKTFVEHGFEGTMVRNAAGRYAVNDRSRDLQKFKDFIDDEFIILSFEEGEGKFMGSLGAFVCATKKKYAKPLLAALAGCATAAEEAEVLAAARKRNEVFNADPADTHEARQAYWDNRNDLRGKALTVQYQNLSDEGVPRFPKALRLREEE